jgi:quercetin dioxygenase-like cupin family protein
MESNIGPQNTDELLGQVTKLVDLINYQKGSIVSRTIIDKKEGTITLFAFDEGQRLSEHTAPFDALVFILDGNTEVSIAGKPHEVNEGEMLIMPANKPHAVKAVKKFKMLLVMIRS